MTTSHARGPHVATELADIARAAASRSVRTAIDRLPRADLNVSPTPFYELERLRALIGGPRLFIKRDDVAGGAFGGNKTRMLEFVLAKAIDQGCDTIVGGSAAQSNYSRQLAAACARLGLSCHLVLRRVRGDIDEQAQGSVLLDLLYGASVEFVGDDRTAQIRALDSVATDLENRGRTVYRAPQASEADKPLHAVAYVEAAIEMLEQAGAAGITPSHIYVSTLDTTHAGLALGLHSLGSSTVIQAISPNEAGVFHDRSIASEVSDVANATAQLLEIESTISPGDLSISVDYVGQAYGVPTPDGLEALRLFARHEGVILDPVYTAKAAAALIDHISNGQLEEESTVVFWHTGGTPALFAYAAELDLN